MKQYFCINKGILKELLVENLAYFSLLCSVWKSGRPKKLSRTDEQYLKVMSLQMREKATGYSTWEMHLTIQLIHPLLVEASPEIVSMKGWLSRSLISKSIKSLFSYGHAYKCRSYKTNMLQTCANMASNFSICSLEWWPAVWIKDKLGQQAIWRRWSCLLISVYYVCV